MIEDDQLVTLGPWKGVNNTDKEESIGADELRSALNVDLDRTGDPRSRPGYVKRHTFIAGRSVFSSGNLLLAVNGTRILRLHQATDTTFTEEVLVADIDPDNEVSFTAVGGTVYWSNEQQSGRILADGTALSIGVPIPPGPIVTATTGGNLTAGQYQVCLTRVDEYGEESGATIASVVDVPANGLITVSGMPELLGPLSGVEIISIAGDTIVSLDGDTIISASSAIPSFLSGFYRIYATPANGDDFFRHAEVPIGTTSFQLTTTVRGPRLETQFTEQLPPGQIIRYYRGRLYVADGPVVWYSEPLRYGLWNSIKNYLPEFPERVTIMEPVHDGIYIVSDKAEFMRGVDPDQFIPETVHTHKGIEGTGQQVPAKMFNANEAIGTCAYWFSENGPCVGYPGGIVNPAAEDKIAFDEYQTGGTLFREQEGIRTITTSLRGKGTSSGFAASDSLTFTVRKKGVVV